MKWTFDNSGLPAFVRIAVEGKATVEESRALWTELITSKEWKPGTAVLVDAQVDESGPGTSERVHKVADLFIEKRDQIGPSCIAVVRRRPERYRYSRQFEYSIRLRGSPVAIRNFTDEASAVEWLKHSDGMCRDDTVAWSRVGGH